MQVTLLPVSNKTLQGKFDKLSCRYGREATGLIAEIAIENIEQINCAKVFPCGMGRWYGVLPAPSSSLNDELLVRKFYESQSLD